MYNMFNVRSSPCPAPSLQSSPLPCTLRAPRSSAALPPPGPHVVPHRMPFFRLSAGRVGVQPAAELRHLRRHNHEPHVLCALLPVPCPHIFSQALPCTLRAPRSPAASCLPARTSSRTVCPSFASRQGASAFNQPLSFDTSGVTYMYAMFYVRSSPCPAPNLQSSLPPHAAYNPAVARRLPPSRPAPRPAPHALPATRQYANSLSNANKLLIRCAWAGTSAFNSNARYGSSWPSGSCSPN